jgi:GT2 family glycosyltransferase
VKLTVGLLTFNCVDLLTNQVASLTEGLAGVADWQLVVADGGSTDGTLELVRELIPHATVVELGTNPGFAAQANAVAAADPESDAILIMSRTSLLHPGCAARMLAAFSRPGQPVGVVVPRLFTATGDFDTSLRRTPTLPRIWGEALLGGRVTRHLSTFTEVVHDPAHYGEATRFEWATGGTTMFSRACLNAIGGWDETMFTYSEETDFELRAADHGFAVVFVPDAHANHLGGLSKARPELWSHLCANRVRLYGKRHRRPASVAFWAAVLLGEALRLPSNTPVRRAAVRKLWRERRFLVAGDPATHPFTGKRPQVAGPVPGTEAGPVPGSQPARTR